MPKQSKSGSSFSKRSIKKGKSDSGKKTTATVTKKQVTETYEVPKRRPDGMLVRDIPRVGSHAEKKRLQKGDRVSGAYRPISGSYKRVGGKIVGFAGNDVCIHDGKGNFYFIDGKNVFR